MSEMRVDIADYDAIKDQMMELEVSVEQTVTIMNLLALVLDGDVFAGTDDLEFLIDTWMTIFEQVRNEYQVTSIEEEGEDE